MTDIHAVIAELKALEAVERERDIACLALWMIANSDWPYIKDSLRVVRLREEAAKTLDALKWELTADRAKVRP